MKVLLLLLIMTLSTLVFTYPQRSSGFERLRDRIHRKRHRHQKPLVTTNETDELFEMSLHHSNDSEDDVESRSRSEKSIPLPLTTTIVPPHHRHHHHHNHHKKNRREKNEELCQSQRKTVELNTQSHEFDPPFVVEVRCLNTPSSSLSGSLFGQQQEQTCFKGMLRCVQQYADVHVTRRGVGSMHWHPFTISDVPVACQCMWPVDRYGHQEF